MTPIECLRELVELKKMKDGRMDYDDMIDYQRRMPLAWAEARRLVAEQEQPK